MPKRVRIPVSAARARLFELTELVRDAGDDTVVVFEHRGSLEGVALVREARLAYLETRVAELEKLVGVPFTLAGSVTTTVDDGALDRELRAIREEWSLPRGRVDHEEHDDHEGQTDLARHRPATPTRRRRRGSVRSRRH